MLKEEAESYESKHLCPGLVDRFDKAVREGARPNTVKTRSERDIDRHIVTRSH